MLRFWGLPDLGKGSVARLREKLGLPSKDGVRPASGLKARGNDRRSQRSL
jgi:hypothetical protein